LLYYDRFLNWVKISVSINFNLKVSRLGHSKQYKMDFN
ncbi:hypothetical protein T4E_10600, partial [Trichinella pseudospiralis]